MNMKAYLDEEIARLAARMKELDPESKEYESVEDSYLKLMSQKLEIEKHEASVEQTEKQMKADRRDRIGRQIAEWGKIILPLGTGVVMTFVAYACEAKGVYPCGIGKKWADKITKY